MLSRYAAKPTATREPRVWAGRKRKGCEAPLAYDSPVRSYAYFGPAGTFTEEALLSQEWGGPLLDRAPELPSVEPVESTMEVRS